MKTRKLIKLVPSLVLCACAVWAPPATADYKAVILDDGWGSRIYGVSSGDQVGIVDGHAAMWSGTAESYVDLNPTGFLYSEARGICGDQKVGWGRGSTTEGNNHALLWSGTPGTWVDLNPLGFAESWAYGVSGNQQVGYGWGDDTEWYYHALMWSGSAETCADLNPIGFIGS